MRGRRLRDLTGQRFARWMVLHLGERRNGRVHWVCRCDCGVEREVKASYLTTGHSRSCGCLQREVTTRRNLEANPGHRHQDRTLAAFNALVAGYHRAATVRGLDWGLSVDACRTLFENTCEYCGADPVSVRYAVNKKGDNTSAYTYNGIDRVDNSIGYISSNVVPCCGDCNRAKFQMTREAFLNWVGRVARHSLGDTV